MDGLIKMASQVKYTSQFLVSMVSMAHVFPTTIRKMCESNRGESVQADNLAVSAFTLLGAFPLAAESLMMAQGIDTGNPYLIGVASTYAVSNTLSGLYELYRKNNSQIERKLE